MAFKPFKPVNWQDTETYIIGNSQTLHIGDAVSFDTTAAANTTATFIVGAGGTTADVYGIILGFTTSPGGTVTQDTLMISAESGSYASASNNQTVGLVRAQVLPVRGHRILIADLTQAAGTTAGSCNPGYFNMDSTNGKLGETTYVIPSGTKGQFFSSGSGVATGSSSHGNTGLFPATSSQVIGYFNKAY